MKRLYAFLIALTFASLAIAQNGWRPGEMEVFIGYENNNLTELRDSGITADYYQDHALAYVTPEELTRLKNKGISYKITIPDLNEHFRNFWIYNRDAYHSYQEIVDIADSLATNFPGICSKTLYGVSVEGRELGALKISDNVSVDEPEAEVFFDAGIHGDEIGGPENAIRFARMLCLEYGSDPDITFLIDNREIWIYYMVNPDGRENMSRYNSNGVDINRDWGFMWDGEGNSTGIYSEIETRALRDCMYENQFVVHTTYHSGTEYISCPWSYRFDAPPDMDHILHLAGIYSSVSGYANLEYGQGSSGMYPINGATKDGNYGTMGSISWSMEISYDKQPPASQIMTFYNYNEPSMLAMIEYSGYGIEGIVTDVNTGKALQATVIVDDLYPVFTDSTAGDYHKYLIPGTYTLKVIANGYESQEVTGVVVQDLDVTVTDFQLVPLDTPRQYAYRVPACAIPGNNHSDEGNIPGILGEPDNINYSLGRDGLVIVDMQKPIQDKPGNDLKVFEGDLTQEGFTIFAGPSIDGPWTFLGTGEGTTEFDFYNAGVAQARYFKIEDDGDGPASGNDAGFDLDAVSDLEHVWGVFLVMVSCEIDDASGNNNGRIDAGETVDMIITVSNVGNVTANNVTGTLTSSSTYITIDQGTASYGSLPPEQSGTETCTITADPSTPTGEVVDFTFTVVANSGIYNTAFEMEYTVGQYPVLIVDKDKNHNSGPIMASIIQDLDIPVSLMVDFPDDLGLYKCIFVCLGTYNNKHILTNSEGQALAGYLNNNGRLYMEGADTWAYDNQTAVHPMFGITGTNDGYGDLGLLLGQDGAFTDGMLFNYTGDNSYIDRMVITTGADEAFELFKNQVPSYFASIANDPGTYKTIGSSFEFGGLADGQSTKEELMIEILEFFGGILTGINEATVENKSISSGFFPNPFKESLQISFYVKEAGKVSIEIYNSTGQLLEVITDQHYNAGEHTIHWSPSRLIDEGLYLYRIRTGDAQMAGKLVHKD